MWRGGAVGLFCAGVAGQLGKNILVLDHAEILGENIRNSGGGRCNFTNLHSSPVNFLSLNQHFVKSALARYPSAEFIKLVAAHGIDFHEKHQGQLFCDDSAKQIIEMLFAECSKGKVTIRNPVTIKSIQQEGDLWAVATDDGLEKSRAVVMATGGLPVPAIGATAYSLDIAKQFGLNVIAPRPALVPLSFTAETFGNLNELAGLSIPVRIAAGSKGRRYGACRFNEDLLLTHKGLSGPAVLQASGYWEEGEPIHIDWLGAIERPGGFNCDELFNNEENRVKLSETILASVLPQRLAKAFADQRGLTGRKWAEVSKKDRQALKELLTNWSVKPAGTLGWKKAEVMLGGVDTKDLDGQTMISRKNRGLFFIGACVDVTGHLGGHNFQWAWASGFVCAQAL
ncbi:NAD(P)/FAD-dependent oxidoreductase [Polynucleobacter necessarius]|uniref:NAD(P)/FAD-dependent oxidoreductase n=1 Tax=Polynucleobacter necessarius TaxID=576610 RepID=UPI001E408AC3|nr:aminoacetone oxidase family FAD-binding enzyme [Polynucleobacter necessarius]